MNRALVTGANGFCGRHLVARLKALDWEIHTMGSHPTAETHYLTRPTDRDAMVRGLKASNPTAVFHLAGTYRAEDFSTFYEVNVMYAANLLSAMEEVGLAEVPVLLVGSAAEYGKIEASSLPLDESHSTRPFNHHGVSKLAQTRLGLSQAALGRPVVMARPFNIVGPGMSDHLVAQNFARQVSEIVRGKREPRLMVGDLNPTRDFVDIDDVVECFIRLLAQPSAYGEVVNICSGRGVSIQTILEKLIELAGIDCEVVVDPERLRPVEIPEHYGSPKKLRDLTGLAPEFRMNDTLRRILDWNARNQ